MPSPRGTALPVGTWARDVGPMRYKLEVKENHLTATITTTDEDDGKSMSVDHILTADFYPTRNPGEVVGLITGFDMTATGPGVSRSDARELTKMLPAIQKALADKPIAFTFRIYDDVLVLGNVRFPSIIGELDEMTKAFEGIAGRYKGSNAAPVTVLSVAASEPARIGVDFNFHPPRFYGAPPVPPMPPPVPLPATQANPFRNGGN